MLSSVSLAIAIYFAADTQILKNYWNSESKDQWKIWDTCYGICEHTPLKSTLLFTEDVVIFQQNDVFVRMNVCYIIADIGVKGRNQPLEDTYYWIWQSLSK
jgi:hypothetical protein